MKNHPIQPIITDDHGTLRFKKNAIVSHLLDHGTISLNDIACMEFTQEDREQFAQLIGYSLSGYSDLGYVRDQTLNAANLMAETGVTHEEARIAALEQTLLAIKKPLREASVAAFPICQEDLVIEEEEPS